MPLFTWTKTDGFALSQELAFFAHDGTIYVGISRSAVTDLYVHSTDGVAWTTTDVTALYGEYSGLVYGGGLFLVTLNDTTDFYTTSPDGLAWTLRTFPATITSANLPSFANGEFFVFDAASGTGYRSSDGISWTSFATAYGTVSVPYQMAYGSGTYVLGHSGGYAVSDDDLASWTATTTGQNCRGVVFYKNRFVRTQGSAGGFYSDDLGLTWDDCIVTGMDPMVDSVAWYSVATAGNHFFAGVQINGLNGVLSSVDGITWEVETDIVAADANTLRVVGGGGNDSGDVFVHGIYDGVYTAPVVPLEVPFEAMDAASDATDTMASPLVTSFFLAEADATDALTLRDIASLFAEADAVIDSATAGQLYAALLDEADASEALRQVIDAVMAAEADAAAALATVYSQFENLRAQLLAADPLLSGHSAGVLLLATATTLDLIAQGFDETMVAEAEASGALLDALRANAYLLAEAEAEVEQTDSMLIAALLDDSADSSDDIDAVASLLALLDSDGFALVNLRLAGEEYSAWVLNADTIGVTQYQNYGFNSFAPFDNKYYGAREDGLYRLDGDDDQGTAIDAWITTGLSNFGTGLVKRMPAFYIGYTSDNGLVLKVVVTDKGEKTEHWYRLDARTANATRADRASPGKGLASVYWQWKLHNIDGGDFNLDTMRFWPMVLTRRVR